ncbi:FAXC-like protein [Mya arenaria]|uniref:FAXC-like protein n=1 Tax=Mya arenaria TaxID=6604 RepID=A0ABY7DZG4_MYAAR|nr:FAXC-like protein [Mya arenaria]
MEKKIALWTEMACHNVRVASRQAGVLKGKLGRPTSSTTPAPPSDESDRNEEEEDPIIDHKNREGSTADAAAAPALPATKKEKKSQDTELRELKDKLTERVEGSREMREKVYEMIKAMENPHTVCYLPHLHTSIHTYLWEDYLRKSHDTLIYYVTGSKRMRRLDEQHQMQPHSSRVLLLYTLSAWNHLQHKPAVIAQYVVLYYSFKGPGLEFGSVRIYPQKCVVCIDKTGHNDKENPFVDVVRSLDGNMLSVYCSKDMMEVPTSSRLMCNVSPFFLIEGDDITVLVNDALTNFRKCGVDYPKDTVILHIFQREKTTPHLGHLAFKLELYLRINKIPYQTDVSGVMGPKQKIPWIEYNGTTMGDSQLIIEFLEREMGVGLNSHLAKRDRAIAWANLATMPKMVKGFMQKRVGTKTYAVGVGRHNNEEVQAMIEKDIRMFSQILGDSEYIMGSQISDVDCAAFGVIGSVYWATPREDRGNALLKSGEVDNVVRYLHRIKEKYWPDWDDLLYKPK